MKKASAVRRILVSVITILFLVGLKLTSFAEESENNLLNTNVTLTVSQNLSVSTDGNKLSVSALVTDDEGQEIDASGALSIYYKKATDSDYKKFTSKSLSVSDGQIFYIYADFAGNDVYAATKSEEIVINVKKFASLKGNIEASATVSGKATGAINLSESYADFNLVTDLAYYRQGNPATTVVSGKSITGLSEGTYYVSAPARQEGNQIYIFSGNQSVKIEEGAQPVINKVTFVTDENVNWSQTYFEAEEGSGRTFTSFLKAADTEKYHITGVLAEPAENADVSYYASTGEVSVSNIKGSVSIKALYEKKSVPSKIELKSVNPGKDGLYSEQNAAIQFTIAVVVTDEDGNAVPDTKVYFKSDKKEVSYTSASNTDGNGIAEIKYSYGVNDGKDKADFESIFSFTADFAKTELTVPIHLVVQKKADLVLYENQIFGAFPEEKNGKVTGVPEGYEIWTGDVHQGALVTGSGSWEQAKDGEFTGLSSGQHVLRAGEIFDDTTNTFYFASNYADFFVPRANWTLTVDEAASENVILTGDAVLLIGPGQTVYISVKAADGYKISGIEFDKEKYVSGNAVYYPEEGYFKIDGIFGNVTAKILSSKDESSVAAGDDEGTGEGEASGGAKEEEKSAPGSVGEGSSSPAAEVRPQEQNLGEILGNIAGRNEVGAVTRDGLADITEVGAVTRDSFTGKTEVGTVTRDSFAGKTEVGTVTRDSLLEETSVTEKIGDTSAPLAQTIGGNDNTLIAKSKSANHAQALKRLLIALIVVVALSGIGTAVTIVYKKIKKQ